MAEAKGYEADDQTHIHTDGGRHAGPKKRDRRGHRGWALDEAAEKLGSAKRWGIWDIVGGGLISSLVKHSRIDDARELLQQARNELESFSDELDDIQENLPEFDLEISDLVSTFDIVFDNVFADILVQEKVEETAREVDKTRTRVKDAVDRLCELRQESD